MSIGLLMNGRWTERKLRPHLVALKTVLVALTFAAGVCHAKETKPDLHIRHTEGNYSGPNSKGDPLDLGRWAEENCKVAFTAKMANNQMLTVLASPGFQLSETAILNDCNRILDVLSLLSSRPFKRDLKLYFAHLEPYPNRWRWSLPAPDAIGFIYLVDDSAREDISRQYAPEGQRTWKEATGECALSAELAHEMTHEVAQVFSSNPDGPFHFNVGMGWFEEGLAEYANYLAWEDFASCPGNTADPEFALKAFLNNSRRKHLWHWQSGVDKDWRPSKGTPPSEVWPSPAKPSREAVSGTDYTTAFGAFLYLEAKVGRERLEAICRQITADHTWQSGAFYKDLEKALGFDIREVGDKDILAVLNPPKPPTSNEVTQGSK